MKVAFISRATLYTSPGGDTQQLDMTAHNLRKLGVEVDVYLANQNIDYSKYDLLHFFNIIRPADILKHIEASRKPYVVSTIFVEYGSTDGVGKVQSLIKKTFGDNALEYFKVIARAVKNGEKIVSASYIVRGHENSIRYVMKKAKILLPNSESEFKRLQGKYNVSGAKHHVIPNGINTDLALKKYPESDKYKGAVLCMGRIEPRKNQLNLIRALNDTDYQLYIHGKPSPNAGSYFEQCKSEAGDNIHFGTHLGSEELFTAYSNAKVHVLPSYFETTGLSSLEAAVMGCNIVVTDRGDTKDYFSDFAWFCEPGDPDSIRQAIDDAYNKPYDKSVREHIMSKYTWECAAEETLKAYKKVFNK